MPLLTHPLLLADDPLWVGTGGSRYQTLAATVCRALRQHMINNGVLDADDDEDDSNDEDLMEEPTLVVLRDAINSETSDSPLLRALGAVPTRDRAAIGKIPELLS